MGGMYLEERDSNGARKHDPLRELRRKTTDLGHDLRDVGRLTGEVAMETLDATGQAAREVMDEGKRKAAESTKRMGSWIRSRPFYAVLASAGIGAAIGWALRRR